MTEIRYDQRRRESRAVFEFSAEDCRNLAACLPSTDGFAVELLDAAAELEQRDTPDPDAPGAFLMATFNNGVRRRLT